MEEQSHFIPVFLKKIKWFIVVEEIRYNLTEDGAEFEAVTRTGWNNKNILMLVGPVDKKIFSFGVCVIAILQFFQFGYSSFEM